MFADDVNKQFDRITIQENHHHHVFCNDQSTRISSN